MGFHLKLALQEQIKATVQGLGFTCAGIEMVTDSGAVLRVYVEGPDNTLIKLDEVTVISRQLAALLEVESPWKGRYRLEVSSPGLDRKLFTIEDYQRFVGREIKVRLHKPCEGRRQWNGELIGVGEDSIVLNVENNHYTFALSAIEKAHLVPEIQFGEMKK